MGARHALLRELIKEAENSKAKRSMYAETQKERIEILDAVRKSVWNREMDPIDVEVVGGEVVRYDFSRGYVPGMYMIGYDLHWFADLLAFQ